MTTHVTENIRIIHTLVCRQFKIEKKKKKKKKKKKRKLRKTSDGANRKIKLKMCASDCSTVTFW